MDFILLHQKGKRIDSGAESLFDIVYSSSNAGDGPSKAKAFWPTQAALLLLCPDILDRAIHSEAGSSATKKVSRPEALFYCFTAYLDSAAGYRISRYAPKIRQGILHG